MHGNANVSKMTATRSSPGRADNRKTFKRARDVSRRLRHVAKFAGLAILAGTVATRADDATTYTPAQVKAALEFSAESYDGACPCPFTIKANGKPCGNASAYSRPGGELVLCFPHDMTPDNVAALVRDGFKL